MKINKEEDYEKEEAQRGRNVNFDQKTSQNQGNMRESNFNEKFIGNCKAARQRQGSRRKGWRVEGVGEEEGDEVVRGQ